MEYNVKIEEFEGPLDLLLHLIKQDNIKIEELSVERITNQYLEYLKVFEDLNITIASSYLVMASELLELKSLSLLPKSKIETTDHYEENSRENLINKLIEYEKYKNITTAFKFLEENRTNIFIKTPENIYNYLEEPLKQEQDDVNVNDLYNAFLKFLERKEEEKPISTKITTKEYSMKERKKSIKEILFKKKKVEFIELFEEYNKSYIIITFISLLEMAKDDEIKIEQESNFNNIYVELKVK